MMILDVLIDTNQMLVVEVGVQGCSSLNEVVSARSLRRATSRQSDQNWPRIKPLDLEVRPLVGILPDGAELTQDGNPDLRFQGNLVSNLDELETGRLLGWPAVTKEPGIDLTNSR